MQLKIGLFATTFCLLSYCGSFGQDSRGYAEPEAHYRNGLEYFEKGNYLAARQEFNEFLKTQGNLESGDDYNSVTAKYYVAVTGLYLGYPEAAVQVDRFARNYAEHPKAQLIFADLGHYYYDNGEYEKAASFLEKAAKRAPGDPKALTSTFQLAMSYFKTNQKAKALPLFNQVKKAKNFANAPDAAYYSGVINYENGKFSDASSDFKSLETNPRYQSEVPNWIVSSLYQEKRYDELVQYGESILAKNKNGKLASVALYVAEVLHEKGDNQGAVNAYKRYEAMAPGKVTPAVLLNFGQAKFNIGDFAGAAETLKPATQGTDSIAQHAAFLSGISYLQSNNPAFALNSFSTAAKLNFNKQIQEEATFNMDKVMVDLGRNSEAIKGFTDFLAKYPNSNHKEEVSLLIADTYARTNNSAGAIAYIEGLKERPDKINETYQRLTFNQGVTDFTQGNYAQAITGFDKSIKFPVVRETFVATNFYKAEALAALNKTKEAVSLYNTIVQRAPGTLFARKSLYSLGYIYYNQKDYARAQNYFADFTKNSEEIEPQTVEDAYARLADCYLAQKNYEAAISTYDRVSNEGKADKDYALFQKGRSYVYMNRNPDAKQQFSQLLAQYPDSRFLDEAMFQLADVDFQSRNYPEAIESFGKLIDTRPQSPGVPSALLRRAQAYYNTQKFEEAIGDFRRVLVDFPTSPAAQSALEGVQESYNAVGRPEEFNQVLSTVRKNNSSDAKLENVEFDNAVNLYNAEKYGNALEAFRQFIVSYPKSQSVADARYYSASSYEKSGDTTQALAEYNQVLRQGSSSFVSNAALRIAEINLTKKNLPGAVFGYRALVKSAQTKREQTLARIGLMDTYFELKKYDSTLVFAKEVINVGNVVPGGVGKAQLYFGKVPYEMGELDKAAEEFNKLAASTKNEIGAEAKYWYAQILFKQKKYKEAEKAVFDLSKEFDGFDYWRVRAFLVLADIYIATDEIGQAKATLTSIIENSEDKGVLAEANKKLAGIPGGEAAPANEVGEANETDTSQSNANASNLPADSTSVDSLPSDTTNSSEPRN